MIATTVAIMSPAPTSSATVSPACGSETPLHVDVYRTDVNDAPTLRYIRLLATAEPKVRQAAIDAAKVFVPTERARNPITHTNWEGTGVRPDVAVPRDRTLEAAYARALDARPSHDVDPAERDRLTNLRRRLAALDDAQVFAL